MKTLALFVSLLWCSLAQSATPPDADLTGDYWGRLDGKAKAAFLSGYRLRTNEIYGEQIPKLIPLIDHFFQVEGEGGARTLVRYAIRVAQLQLDGKPQQEIDKVVIEESERPWK